MALFNRKNKEDKKKSGENIVGKIIYIFLLFAPLFSILTTCLYTIFNKNAFESYYGETINEEIKIQINYDELKDNETYYFDNLVTFVTPTINQDGVMNVQNCVNINGFNDNVDLSNVAKLRIYVTNNYNTMYFTDINDQTITTIAINQKNAVFKFTFKGYTPPNFVGYQYVNYFYKIEYNKYSYLDNSFDYGIYKTEQNNLFNWAKNTGTYTIMKTTTDGLEINNTFIPMLLTYWLIISVIYFIYDIALMLIWILHRKIHELTESV